ncbi:FMN-binding protein [Lactococcus nasutitermitis]|uniref:FMN-binding protein n=1 Tax=Lactococcus nasutitermitis TaxID=1652957 RepID=A0ABV9JF49_9LACT|nr:FMN-binding protein [Lactococcus nasutitermitis]
MLSHKFLEALEYEGAVSLTSWGEMTDPHVTGTWISRLYVTEDERVLAPAIGMYMLENDIALNDKVLMLIGVREVEGHNGYHGIGFKLTSKATLISTGKEFDMMKEKYPTLRKVLVLTPIDLEQLL